MTLDFLGSAEILSQFEWQWNAGGVPLTESFSHAGKLRGSAHRFDVLRRNTLI